MTLQSYPTCLLYIIICYLLSSARQAHVDARNLKSCLCVSRIQLVIIVNLSFHISSLNNVNCFLFNPITSLLLALVLWNFDQQLTTHAANLRLQHCDNWLQQDASAHAFMLRRKFDIKLLRSLMLDLDLAECACNCWCRCICVALSYNIWPQRAATVGASVMLVDWLTAEAHSRHMNCNVWRSRLGCCTARVLVFVTACWSGVSRNTVQGREAEWWRDS